MVKSQFSARKVAATICQNLAATNIIYALGGDGTNSTAHDGAAKLVSESNRAYTVIASSNVSGLAAGNLGGEAGYKCIVQVKKGSFEILNVTQD